jgi:transcriptional regulator with XRE-family HTH domain
LTLGIDIRKARRALGLNQSDFAAKLGLKQSAISHWERGHDKPSARNLQTLAKVLGDRRFITVDALFEEAEPLPQAKMTKANGLVDGLLDILSRIEALEQRVELFTTKKLTTKERKRAS